jgi:hypothetical protein
VQPFSTELDPRAATAARARFIAHLREEPRVVLVDEPGSSVLEREAARGHARDFDPATAVTPGKQLTPEWYCGGFVSGTVGPSDLSGGLMSNYRLTVTVSVFASAPSGRMFTAEAPEYFDGDTRELAASQVQRLIGPVTDRAFCEFQERLPPITGYVVEVPRKGRCLIDLGRGTGVRGGLLFDVYRDGTRQGRIVVAEVGATSSNARRIGGVEPRTGDEIRSVIAVQKPSAVGRWFGRLARHVTAGVADTLWKSR